MSGTPFFGVQSVSSGGLVASTVLKTGKARLHWVFPYNNNGSARYVMVFDAAALPVNGSAPLWMYPLTATSAPAKELAFPPEGLLCTAGIVIALSTTPTTLTIAAADLLYTVGVS